MVKKTRGVTEENMKATIRHIKIDESTRLIFVVY